MPGICGFYSCLPRSNAQAITQNMLVQFRGTEDPITHQHVDEHGHFGLAQASGRSYPRVSQSASLYDRQLKAVMQGELEQFDQLFYALRAQSRIYLDDHAAIMLACYANKGLEGLCDLRGRFTAAILDLSEQSITVVNAEANTQPIYYAYTSNCFSFSSSLTSLLTNATVTVEIDSNCQHLERHAHIGGIKTLLPGSSVVFDSRQNHVDVNEWRSAQSAYQI
jgi:asparagine synthetase B (glutamine-hydrolysing)